MVSASNTVGKLERFGAGMGTKLIPLADDVAMYANSHAASGSQVLNPNAIPDGEDVKNAKKLKNVAGRAAGLGVGTVAARRAVEEPFKPIGEESGLFKATEPLANIAEKGASGAMMGLMGAELALPLLAGGAGLVARVPGLKPLKTAEKWLNAPKEYLHPPALAQKNQMTLGGKLNNGLMAGFSAVALYGVAKTASQGLDSLKHMNEALTGVPADKVSTIGLLTSNNVPDLVKEARSHFIKEHLGRAGANLAGIGLIVRSMLRKKSLGFLEMFVPAGAGMAVDVLMGESALPYFAGVANAQKMGQALPPQAYAEFLMATSKDLKDRGAMGRQVAMGLGEIYAAQNMPIGNVLKEIEASSQAHKHGGASVFDQRVSGVIAKAEAERAAMKKARGGHEMHHTAAKPEVSMVNKIGKGAQPHDVEVKGKFTQKLQQEMTADKGLGSVTV